MTQMDGVIPSYLSNKFETAAYSGWFMILPEWYWMFYRIVFLI